jgi:hypothetical protein
MALAAGRFGPALKSEHTEKSWPPKYPWRWHGQYYYIHFTVTTDAIEKSQYSKFYGAEWMIEEE